MSYFSDRLSFNDDFEKFDDWLGEVGDEFADEWNRWFEEEDKFEILSRSIKTSDYSYPLVYGEATLGGAIVWYSSSEEQGKSDGDDDFNEVLHMVIGIAEGEIQAIDKIFINDYESTDSVFLDDEGGRYLYTYKVLGHDNQAAQGVLMSQSNAWGLGWRWSDKLSGLAYVYLRMERRSSMGNDDPFGSGIPNIKFKIKGRKVRRIAGVPYGNNSRYYSTNPIECYLDYLQHRAGGKLDIYSKIQSTWEHWKSAAEACNKTAVNNSVNTPLFSVNLPLDTSQTVGTNLRILEKHMRARSPVTYLQPPVLDLAQHPVIRITGDDFAAMPTIATPSRSDRYNRVSVTYKETALNGDINDVDAVWPVAGSSLHSQWLADDGNQPNEFNTSLKGINNAGDAQRMARYLAYRSRSERIVSAPLLPHLLGLTPGDVVDVDLSNEYGGLAGRYVVTKFDRQNRVATLIEQVAEAIDDAAITTPPAPPVTRLPDPRKLLPPSLNPIATNIKLFTPGSNDGRFTTLSLTIEATENTTVYSHANVRYKLGAGRWQYPAGSADPYFEIQVNHTNNRHLTVEARPVSRWNKKGSWQRTKTIDLGAWASPDLPLITEVSLDAFIGREARISWAPLFPRPEWLRDYFIQIVRKTDNVVLYETGTGDDRFVITEDLINSKALGRDFKFRVMPRAMHGFTGTATEITVNNPAPAAPSTFNAVARVNRIELSWTPPANDIDFVGSVIYYRKGGAGNFLTRTVDQLTNSLVLDFLDSSSAYQLKIASIDAFGIGDESPIVYATTTAPLKPSSFVVTPGINEATLTLTAPPEYRGLKLWYGDAAGITGLPVYIGQDLSIKLPGLLQGTDYKIYYRAKDIKDVSSPELVGPIAFRTKQITAPDVTGLSPWATKNDPANKAWMIEHLTGNAIPSTLIENLTAAKLSAGYITAELGIQSGGSIETINSGYKAGIGVYNDGGVIYTMVSMDDTGDLKFGVTADGKMVAKAADITGRVTITGGSGYAQLEDRPAQGVNYIHPEIATNSAADYTLNATNGTFAVETADVGQPGGANCLSLKCTQYTQNTTRADAYVYLTTGGSIAANTPIPPNRFWMISAWVKSDTPGCHIEIFLKGESGRHKSKGFILKDPAGQRVAAVLDLSTWNDRAVMLRLDVNTLDATAWFDEIMLEPTHAGATIDSASDFIHPISLLNKEYTSQIAQEKSSDALTAATDYANANFIDKVSYATDIQSVRDQIDKSITTWFFDSVPTLANAPVSGWATNADKDVHLGDLYYDNLTGYSYRFKKENSVYSWLKLSDSDVTKALVNAATAQDTADNKRRVFFDTPVTPYDKGDLWDTGSGLKRANATNITTYSSSQWVWVSDAAGAAQSAKNGAIIAAAEDATNKAQAAQAAAEATAIDADLRATKTVIDGGLVTTGGIELSGSAGYVRAGKSSFPDASTGFWLGIYNGKGAFHAGNSGSHIKFDSANGLDIKGKVTIVSGSGYAKLTDKPSNLAAINSTEGEKLGSIEEGADATDYVAISDDAIATAKKEVETGLVAGGLLPQPTFSKLIEDPKVASEYQYRGSDFVVDPTGKYIVFSVDGPTGGWYASDFRNNSETLYIPARVGEVIGLNMIVEYINNETHSLGWSLDIAEIDLSKTVLRYTSWANESRISSGLGVKNIESTYKLVEPNTAFLKIRIRTNTLNAGDLFRLGIHYCQIFKVSNIIDNSIAIAEAANYTNGEIDTLALATQNEIDTKANLAEVTAKAHADNIVTAEEQRAIADAQLKADAAQVAAVEAALAADQGVNYAHPAISTNPDVTYTKGASHGLLEVETTNVGQPGGANCFHFTNTNPGNLGNDEAYVYLNSVEGSVVMTPIPPHRFWILSAWVKASVANTVIQLFIKGEAGKHLGKSFVLSDTNWIRVAHVFDLSNWDDRALTIRLDIDTLGADCWFDEIMLEPAQANYTAANVSPYVLPISLLNQQMITEVSQEKAAAAELASTNYTNGEIDTLAAATQNEIDTKTAAAQAAAEATAIDADLRATKTVIDGGLITTGGLELSGSAGYVRAGKASFAATTAGIWLGQYNGGGALHVGNANEFIKYDKTNGLSIKGKVEIKAAAGSTPILFDTVNIDTDVIPTGCPYVVGVAATNGKSLSYTGEYIPVVPGEELTLEMWAMQTGSTVRAYMGIERFDKNKKPISSNTGTVYVGMSNDLLPTTWQKFSGSTVIPTTHTVYDGSNGEGVYFIRPRVLYNYQTTGQAYYSPFKIYRSQNMAVQPLNKSSNMLYTNGELIKTGNTIGWDAQGYSNDSILGNGIASCKIKNISGTPTVMFGLATDPVRNTSYVAIDYAIYVTGNEYHVYESGTGRGKVTNRPVTVGDRLTVEYTGRKIRYFINDIMVRALDVAAGLTLHIDTSFYSQAASLSDFKIRTAAEVGTTAQTLIDGGLITTGTITLDGASGAIMANKTGFSTTGDGFWLGQSGSHGGAFIIGGTTTFLYFRKDTGLRLQTTDLSIGASGAASFRGDINIGGGRFKCFKSDAAVITTITDYGLSAASTGLIVNVTGNGIDARATGTNKTAIIGDATTGYGGLFRTRAAYSSAYGVISLESTNGAAHIRMNRLTRVPYGTLGDVFAGRDPSNSGRADLYFCYESSSDGKGKWKKLDFTSSSYTGGEAI